MTHRTPGFRITHAAMTLALFMVGCGDDSAGGGGGAGTGNGGGAVIGGAASGGSSDGGAGGAAPSCGTEATCELAECKYAEEIPGACTNEADLVLMQPLNWDIEWNKCVPDCVTDAECSAKCFNENTGISDPCSLCYGELASCWISKCYSKCGNGGGTPECFACVEEACVPDFDACFGKLACPYELSCGDHLDNDEDGLVDGEDPECGG